jgi:hypothetical protein
MSKVTPEKFNQIIGAELPSAAETGIYLRSIDEGSAELEAAPSWCSPIPKNRCAPAVPLPGPS